MKKLFLLIILISCYNNYALRLTPMAGYLQPNGFKSKFNFTAINTTQNPEAVKVRIEYRNPVDQEKYGKPANKLFQVYPTRAILFPKSSGKVFKKDIKIVWKGGEIKDIERSFRLIVEQVPLNFSKKKINGGKVQIVPRYIASVYVSPESFSSQPIIKSQKVKNNKIIVEIENQGKKHHLIRDLMIKIDGQKLSKDELQGMILHSVLADTTRRFVLNLPQRLRHKRVNKKRIQVKL